MTDRQTTNSCADTRNRDGVPTVVSIVGPSGAGKTTLVEALVSAFDDRRVATVKSIHHDIEPDTPGADTHRHRTAGADTAIGITPQFTFEITPGGKGPDRDDTDAELAALSRVLKRLATRGFELVLIEGFSEASLPQIRVGTDDCSGENCIGTDADSIERLRAAIEATGAIDPAMLFDG